MENRRALLLRLISTFIQRHCPCFAHEDLEQAAQQNGAIRDKDFACEGAEGREAVDRAEEQTRGQTRWQLGQGLFLQYLACGPLPTTKERSSSLYLRRMDETLKPGKHNPKQPFWLPGNGDASSRWNSTSLTYRAVFLHTSF